MHRTPRVRRSSVDVVIHQIEAKRDLADERFKPRYQDLIDKLVKVRSEIK